MSKLGKMSFIMPAYDIAWRTIKRAIDSILDQDYRDWELIVVKNGTIDAGKIAEIVRTYTDPRIQLLEFEQSGACFARNKGAEVATGDFYSFFSSDFILKPGMLRHWLELFRDNPEYSMVYGGYTWTDDSVAPFRSQEHDQYLLERGYNYIDGGFPIRKEIYKPWDEDCKSLNDWEWVINILKGGAKPLYDHEFAYSADLPKPGGLSHDSSTNWVERVKYIKTKHNIPDSPICVSSLGAPYHGIKTAKLLNADFKSFPMGKENNYKMIYLLGFYVGSPQSVRNHTAVFAGTSDKKVKKVIHWIGSDIQTMMGLTWGSNRNMVDAFKREGFIHLCECGSTQAELEAMGIEAKVLPLPMPMDDFKVTPLPKEPVVAVYCPENNQHANSQYNLVAMKDIAESMPDVKFKFFGHHKTRTEGNIEYVGYIENQDMPKFIQSCSAILRITLHDGLPISVIEFLLSGREAIVSVPNMSGAYYVGHGKIDEENYATKKEEIIKAIRSSLKSPSTAREKLDIVRYWRDKVSVRKFKEEIYKILHA